MTNKRKIRRAKWLQAKAVKRFEKHHRLLVSSIYVTRTPIVMNALFATCMMSAYPNMSQLAIKRFAKHMYSQFTSSCK